MVSAAGLCRVPRKKLRFALRTPRHYLIPEQVRQWQSLAPLQQPRYNHTVAVIDNFLYVVGGNNTNGLVTTVERYNYAESAWSEQMPSFCSPYGVANGIWLS
jgi:hypothetical protein